MSLSSTLSAAPGTYFGTGDGPESGPFLSRLVVAGLPNGGVSIDYEATSRGQGLQHAEHSLLAPGADGRHRLYIAHSESPFITEMIESGREQGRFVNAESTGPVAIEVVITVPAPGRITYSWWWANAGDTPTEQSRAVASIRP